MTLATIQHPKHSGLTVAASADKHTKSLTVATYSNRKQAEKRAEAFRQAGYETMVSLQWPFIVMVEKIFN